MGVSPDFLFAYAIVIFFAIGLHEYAHCKFADMAGDPTARNQGRVTLNLFKHFEPMGTIMIFLSAASGVGIGWGRPAPINPSRMRNPRWDCFVAVLAGPVSNILQATVWAVIFRFGAAQGFVVMPQPGGTISFALLVCLLGVTANVGMAVFNMIPLGPLDGHWIVGLLLPERARDKWFWWQRRYGGMLLLALIIGSQLLGASNPRLNFFASVLYPAVRAAMRFLLGPVGEGFL